MFKGVISYILLTSSFEYLYATEKTSTTLSDSITQLQLQIKDLQTEINGLKNQNNDNPQKDSSFSTYSSKVLAKSNNKENTFNPYLTKNSITTDTTTYSIKDLEEPYEGVFNTKNGINVEDAPVITSEGHATFIGSYSGNNSIPIGQIPTNLFASTILGQRNKFDNYEIFFGGLITLNAQTWFGDNLKRVNFENEHISNFSANGENIYLMDAALHVLANIGEYVTASYDISSGEEEEFSLNNAFVIFGNTTVSPFFVTVGRSQLSVSTFNGGGPSTASIADYLRVGKATNISLNYKTQALNLSLAAFTNDDKKADFSAGLFYADSLTKDITLGFNTGYVYDLNGAENENISLIAPEKTIGVYNIDSTIAYSLGEGIFQFNTGWATSTKPFDFNATGSDVYTGAWYATANYSLMLRGKSTNFGVSYGQTYNASAIPMLIAGNPIQDGLSKYGIQKQLIFSAQRAFFDEDVIFGPEWAYQKFYDGSIMNTLSLEVSIYL
ncbi:membrane protein [Candidatus Francisella endociliophora]|uniref:Membrane protein n=1 Tax=Candidatus Francisella endociliophora TaxID=653937 RepID=A0A097ERW8_9GAMM|nr:membrane protein [Francisella sp. FSC1006]